MNEANTFLIQLLLITLLYMDWKLQKSYLLKFSYLKLSLLKPF